MTKLIELDLTDTEQESYIRTYISDNMLETSLEQYIHVLNITDNVAEASKAAILNEFLNIALTQVIK